jgi:pimeloyl-ACP methyl ester carboxylesterase
MEGTRMETVVSKDGTRLAYDVVGEGPALVHVTGAVCHRTFFPILKDVKTLAKAFTVYSFDRRGRGDSGDTRPYAPGREVDDIEAIIGAADGRAFVYGHSSGAVLALEAAACLPRAVRKVVLHDASYVSDESDKESYALLRRDVAALLQGGRNGQALRRFLVGIGMPKAFAYALPLIPGWGKLKALVPTLEYDMALTADVPPLDRIRTIDVPTRIVVGEKNPPSIHAVGRLLAEAIPGATITRLQGQDHMADAKHVLPVLEEFFRD